MRVAVEAGYFTIPEREGEAPRLLGCRCRGCDEVFFPRRVVCARCLCEELDELELGPRGILYTYTYCHVPLFGSRRAGTEGYGVGQIDLPEGPRVQGVLAGGPGDFEIGMEMELDLEVLRVNERGEEVVIFRFRPRAGSGGQAAGAHP
ncbi:MAG: OB-fold domain-containing protein [Deltaproteobacteria bacterium]|nr:OB-fold domain-containing protein [Deltaproteobacteria bacterium]